MSSGEEEDGSGEEMQRLVQARNKKQHKKNKSGGWQSMGLSPAVFKAILRKGYQLPSPIQRKTIPLILAGKDVVAMASTGSGKTAAFLVPMLEHLKVHSSTGARALILSPTRILAEQTMKFTKELGKFTDLRVAVVLGGDRMEDQFAALHQSPDIVIATPGRLLHVLVEMKRKLQHISYVVFDEADKLFEMGFAEQLHEILDRVPEKRQTVMFSATLPKTLVSFAQAGLSDPTLIRLDVDTSLSPRLKRSFLWCRAEDKEAALLHLLLHVVDSRDLTVVFVATKHHVEYLHTLLLKCGVSCTYIYSSLDQTARKIHLARFQQKQAKVMVVTDLAARGIDIPQLDNVVNFNFPSKPKLFVHRVGRVARAGRHGTAYSLVASDELGYFFELHMFLGCPVRAVPKAGGVEDENGYFGLIPRNVINKQEEQIQTVSRESSDLADQKRVSLNAYKHYVRSRPVASAESVRRGKLLEKETGHIGYHPIFKQEKETGEEVHEHVMSVLRNYKGKATIFEINATAKKASHANMQAKRRLHDGLIERAREQATIAASNSSLPAQTLSDADDDDLHQAFRDNTVTVGASVKTRKRKNRTRVVGEGGKAKDRRRWTDRSSCREEGGAEALPPTGVTGPAIRESFNTQIQSAVLDFIGDDQSNMKAINNTRRWDRKRKRFVGPSQDGKVKKVKTESGNWIPASYQSKLYQSWRKKEKVEESQAHSDEDSTPRHTGHRKPHKAHTGLQILGTAPVRGRKWHTRGSAAAQEPGGSKKRKFQPGKGRELKSSDRILKERRQKSKVQAFQKHRQVVRSKKKANKRNR